jgi:hypothetical protein
VNATQPTAQLFAASSDLTPRECIAVFHRWIQTKRFPEILLLDVADYSHVADGPVVLLVAHEGFLSLNREYGRLGLLWRERRGEPRAAGDGLRAAASMVLRAAQELERDAAGKIRFAPGELSVGFDDRLHAPNDAATLAALRPDLEALGTALYGRAEVTQGGDPKSCFRASLRGAATSLAELVTRHG